MTTPILDVKGIGPATAERLSAAGITTAEALAATTVRELADIPGFGAIRAKQIIAQALQAVGAASPDSSTEQSVPSPDTTKGKKAKKKKPKKKAAGKKGKAKKEKKKKDKGKKDKTKVGKTKKSEPQKKAKKKK
jgi:NAD-dependent DNA ligase